MYVVVASSNILHVCCTSTWQFMALSFLPCSCPLLMPSLVHYCHRIKNCLSLDRSVQKSVWDVWVYILYSSACISGGHPSVYVPRLSPLIRDHIFDLWTKRCEVGALHHFHVIKLQRWTLNLAILAKTPYVSRFEKGVTSRIMPNFGTFQAITILKQWGPLTLILV